MGWRLNSLTRCIRNAVATWCKFCPEIRTKTSAFCCNFFTAKLTWRPKNIKEQKVFIPVSAVFTRLIEIKTETNKFYLTILLFVVLLCEICFLSCNISPPHFNEDQTNKKKRYFPLTRYGGSWIFHRRKPNLNGDIGDAIYRWGDASLLQFKCWLYFHSRAMALFHYYDAATVRNQHQLLTCKTSKWYSLLF